MAVPTAQEVLAKWKSRTSAAATDYVDGARRTEKDPTALAIAAIPYMRSRILEAIDTGQVANGLRRAGRAGWLAGVESKGAQNFGTGVANADAKVLDAFTPLLAYIDNGLRQISGMSANSPAERKARMTAWFDIMSNYQRTG